MPSVIAKEATNGDTQQADWLSLSRWVEALLKNESRVSVSHSAPFSLPLFLPILCLVSTPRRSLRLCAVWVRGGESFLWSRLDSSCEEKLTPFWKNRERKRERHRDKQRILADKAALVVGSYSGVGVEL
jgi:hypothetical protein